ncbi:MAG TPA: 4-(cytidine 5'-diphospho)-2-C-methyl-D-erythritol kinase [Gemmatimonadaceae bacterium]|nr:4-(cytidine 5'-diphospho)-2-C-methyl-D-erythritol kinase [Gemmatimonadaceae bacterium]
MTGPAARVTAQAKINLHLGILSREDSGFHSIETIFHRIDLADEIAVHVTDGERSIDVAGAEVGPAESNLAYRAAVLYAAQSGWPAGFRIELVKHIPAGAGLGGGSADAGAVLRALDMLSPNPMGSHTLLQIAGKLGSDVPFLTDTSVMALAWSRGDRMLGLPALPRRDLLLMIPEFAVSTADAYRWLDEDRAAQSVSYRTEPSIFTMRELSDWAAIARFACNDFEAPVVARHPAIGELLGILRRSRSLFAQMSGSGSTIYGVLDGPAQYAKVPEEYRERVRTSATSIDVLQPMRIE